MADQRYKIYEQLGAGGNGAVYRAYDTQLKRWVAIKRLLTASEAASEDPSTTELRREADTLASLRNANIVTIFDVGTDDEGLFMVMELLEGPDLADTIVTAPLGLDDFKQLAEQTLEALLAAHQLRILHRDIKPENIKVERLPGGRLQAKLIDFGLARAGLGARKQTEDHTGSVMGSIYYMAPEQLSREPVDIRTDLYALGCVLYEAISARKPFDGKTVNEVIDKHLDHDVVPLGQLCPHLPQWLTYWVMRLMSCKPDDRPESAQRAIEEFRAWEKLPPQPQMVQWGAPGYGYAPVQAYGMPPQTGGVPLQTTGYHMPVPPGTAGVPVPVPLVQPVEEPIYYATPVVEQPRPISSGVKPQRPQQPGKKAAPAPKPKAANHKPVVIGLGAAVVIAVIAFFFLRGESGPSNPAPAAPAVSPLLSLQPANEGLFPMDRAIPVNDQLRVVHLIAKAGTLTPEGNPTTVKQNAVGYWADLAARGKNTQMAAMKGDASVAPRLVPWKGGALKPDRFAIRFSQPKQPSGMKMEFSDQVSAEFPFGSAVPGYSKGLTLGVAFEADDRALPTRVLVLRAIDGTGEVSLTVTKDKGLQAKFVSAGASKTLVVDSIPCTDPVMAFLRWDAKGGEIELRVRQGTNNVPVFDKLPAPTKPLCELQIGKPAPPADLQFHGFIAECIIYSVALKEDQLALFSKAMHDYYLMMRR
jgi:eukaryotic-like serine/threonine-protein kinase